jgi:hypothetical protein
MGRIRIDIEVESIDLSILCHEDYSIDSIQVFKGRKWINNHPHDTYRDVGWMFNADGLAAIEDKLAERVREMAEDLED